VVDLTTQQVVWRQGNGFWQLGFPASAGSFVTAGGLVFNGGVMDGQLRAMDVYTGEVLWQAALPSGSDATPMTYVSPRSGRQYVLVTVPGQSRPTSQGEGHAEAPDAVEQAPRGGRIMAYALPSDAG